MAGESSAAASLPSGHFKVAVVGARAVGKTTLVRAWAQKELPSLYLSTSGVQIHHLPAAPNSPNVLVVHDVGGTATCEQAAGSLRDADVVVLVYDYRRRAKTLQVLQKDWVPQARFHRKTRGAYFLVANMAYEHLGSEEALPVAPEENVDLGLDRGSVIQTERFSGLDSIRKNAARFRADLYFQAMVSRADLITGVQAAEVEPAQLTARKTRDGCHRWCSLL